MSMGLSVDDGVMSIVGRSNTASTGSAWVTVHGSGLGTAALTATVRGGETGCEGTEWESGTSVRCLGGQGGRGTSTVVVTAGHGGGSATGVFSTDTRRLMGTVEGYNTGATGSAGVTVHGSGLGTAALTATGRGGETGCEGTEWESETSVRCRTVHGGRGSGGMTVTVGERGGSMTEAWSVDEAEMTMGMGRNGGGTG